MVNAYVAQLAASPTLTKRGALCIRAAAALTKPDSTTGCAINSKRTGVNISCYRKEYGVKHGDNYSSIDADVFGPGVGAQGKALS